MPMASLQASKIKLRFYPSNDFTKRTVQDAGKKHLIDLTLKASKSWTHVTSHLSNKWGIPNLSGRLKIFYRDMYGSPSGNLLSNKQINEIGLSLQCAPFTCAPNEPLLQIFPVFYQIEDENVTVDLYGVSFKTPHQPSGAGYDTSGSTGLPHSALHKFLPTSEDSLLRAVMYIGEGESHAHRPDTAAATLNTGSGSSANISVENVEVSNHFSRLFRHSESSSTDTGIAGDLYLSIDSQQHNSLMLPPVSKLPSSAVINSSSSTATVLNSSEAGIATTTSTTTGSDVTHIGDRPVGIACIAMRHDSSSLSPSPPNPNPNPNNPSQQQQQHPAEEIETGTGPHFAEEEEEEESTSGKNIADASSSSSLSVAANVVSKEILCGLYTLDAGSANGASLEEVQDGKKKKKKTVCAAAYHTSQTDSPRPQGSEGEGEFAAAAATGFCALSSSTTGSGVIKSPSGLFDLIRSSSSHGDLFAAVNSTTAAGLAAKAPERDECVPHRDTIECGLGKSAYTDPPTVKYKRKLDNCNCDYSARRTVATNDNNNNNNSSNSSGSNSKVSPNSVAADLQETLKSIKPRAGETDGETEQEIEVDVQRQSPAVQKKRRALSSSCTGVSSSDGTKGTSMTSRKNRNDNEAASLVVSFLNGSAVQQVANGKLARVAFGREIAAAMLSSRIGRSRPDLRRITPTFIAALSNNLQNVNVSRCRPADKSESTSSGGSINGGVQSDEVVVQQNTTGTVEK